MSVNAIKPVLTKEVSFPMVTGSGAFSRKSMLWPTPWRYWCHTIMSPSEILIASLPFHGIGSVQRWNTSRAAPAVYRETIPCWFKQVAAEIYSFVYHHTQPASAPGLHKPICLWTLKGAIGTFLYSSVAEKTLSRSKLSVILLTRYSTGHRRSEGRSFARLGSRVWRKEKKEHSKLCL